ncbi:TPA: hypothetical protein ACYSCU_005156, partial [Citrobacter sedlakii]
ATIPEYLYNGRRNLYETVRIYGCVSFVSELDNVTKIVRIARRLGDFVPRPVSINAYLENAIAAAVIIPVSRA